MSRSKQGFGPSGRGAFPDVTRQRPCPVCGASKWCQLSRAGDVALCKRVESPREKVNKLGTPFWVHFLEPGAVRALPPEPDAPGVVAAPDAVLDQAHRALLGALGLSAAHRHNLRNRGLSDDAIDAGLYRTLPLEGRARLARALTEDVGAAATQVPGYRVASADGRSWASFGGSPGLLIPVRNLAGQIVALKVRRDDADNDSRYLYVSSARHGGASARVAVHVPVSFAASPVVRLTEGELKADVCTALGRLPTLSLPGVSCWREALPVLDRLGAERVHVAFDADWQTNRHVAAALRDLVDALGAAGVETAIDQWDPAFKGLDDYLAARAHARKGRAA